MFFSLLIERPSYMRIIVQRRNIKEKIQSTRDHISNLMTTASDKVYIVVKHQQS